MASPVYADPEGPIRLAVLGDSTAFTGPHGPLLPDEPALYPNVAARAISDAMEKEVRTTVLAHPGAGVRDAWFRVTKDRHAMFDVLMKADAVVIGLGSLDHGPAGIPLWIDSLVPFVRPAPVRRAVRRLLRTIHPIGVAATRGRMTRVPEKEFQRLYDGMLHHVRSLSFGAPGVALGPVSHRSPYYGRIHPQRERRERLQTAIAKRHGFPVVPVWPLVEPWTEKLNADGLHWPFEVHEAVGLAVAELLIVQLRGERPAPGVPDGGAEPS